MFHPWGYNLPSAMSSVPHGSIFMTRFYPHDESTTVLMQRTSQTTRQTSKVKLTDRQSSLHEIPAVRREKITFMNVRLSPVCGLITDRPSTRTTEVNHFARPLHWETCIRHTHHTAYQCLASLVRIMFLLLNTCGMRPRRSNKKY